MAVHAAVSRQMYPIGAYHTTQAASTASIHASHQDVQARGMYGQSFGFPHQMFAYPHYPITAQAAYATHAPPQNYSPVSPPGSAVLLSQQNPSTLHSSPSQGIPASPRLKLEQPPYSHMKVEPASYHHLKVEPPYSQLKAEQSAFPHMKVEQSSFPQMKTESASYPQLKVEQSTSSAASSSGSGPNTNAAPGPIPATTPLVVRQDQNGVQWIAFEYSRDRVKMEYCIRCDVESVAIDDLTLEFKAANCVYPGAYSGKEGYKGNRLHYESECNAVGWALAHLNPALREKRGLIQRAVDSWRNSNQDPRLRSRRVRRQAKINNRKAQMRQPGTPVSLSAAEVLAGNRLPPAVPVGSTRPTPLNVSAGQLHHHHSTSEGTGSEGVSGMFHM